MSDESQKKTGSLPEWCSCKHSIDHLVDFVDGALPEDEHRQIERHFKLCPPCREFLGKYRALPGMCQKALDQDVPEETADRLASFLRSRLKSC